MVVILAVVLMLFGAKKLPELAKGLGQGIKEFKKATRDVNDEITSAMDETPESPKRLPPSEPAPTVQSTQPSSAAAPTSPNVKA